jgi:hypothetical protein
MSQDNTQYLLAALIEIYRGQAVPLPEADPELEKNLLCDVYSSAISFARFDESRQTLSEDIFRCSREGATIKGEAMLAQNQTPDVLNAKMIAAAHMMKVFNPSRFTLS